jgi:hypothetical protein
MKGCGIPDFSPYDKPFYLKSSPCVSEVCTHKRDVQACLMIKYETRNLRKLASMMRDYLWIPAPQWSVEILN